LGECCKSRKQEEMKMAIATAWRMRVHGKRRKIEIGPRAAEEFITEENSL